jgi:hypothetical protein
LERWHGFDIKNLECQSRIKYVGKIKHIGI